MSAKLLIVSEQLQTTQELAFDKPRLTIGRKAGNDLFFNRPEISGNHAAFLMENDQFFVQDLGSTNGTFMNGGQCVAQERYPLSEQDVIIIAPYRITLVLTPDISRTLAESAGRDYNRVESGTIIDHGGQQAVKRIATGTAEHEVPAPAPPPPAAPPPPPPAPKAAPISKPAPEPKPAPAPPAPAKPAAPPPEPKPAPKPAAPRPAPAAPAFGGEREEVEPYEPELPGSTISDYLWLGIGAICFFVAVGLILYLIFGF